MEQGLKWKQFLVYCLSHNIFSHFSVGCMQDVNEEDFGGDVKEIDTMQGNCKEARIGTQWGLNI